MPPRNPDWNRDELILALAAYVRWKGSPPAKTSAEIAALSQTMSRLGRALGTATGGTFRNTNGVYMKAMNYRRFDPAFIEQGRVGLTRGNRLEEVVWAEFAHDPDRLARVAKAIVAALDAEVTDAGLFDASALDEVEEAVEGRVLTELHRRRERSPLLVEKKKAATLKLYGRLACEICAFDFAVQYGERGAGFIECHHLRPVETLGDGSPTRLDELAMLCANCHRMIHSRRPWLSPADLKALTAIV